MEGYNVEDEIRSQDIKKGVQIGRGGFAEVYRGQWKPNDDVIPVALKCMTIDDTSLVSETLEREMQLRFLDHPNIIKFLGVCYIDGDVTLVLELSPDGALDEWIFKQKKSFVGRDGHANRVLKLFAQCAKGLDYLHSRPNPIIHRDVKPGNMLLFNGGEILKITDMGLSKVIGEESMTATQGTMKYMSPEVMKTGDYGSKADVFSFGISFFAIFTCQKPFGNMFDHIKHPFLQLERIIDAVSNGLRPEPVPEEPPGVGELMESCWHGDPQERPTMNAVISKIRKIKWNMDYGI